ncbi:MAG: hypothetical protein JNJ90_00040 [Saprospiraceae bacterium]|nr:hypothetical protein [Saprospiraceae bacterium]
MNTSASLSLPLSNLQLELLQLYASNVSEDDLLKIREMLARFFLEKAKDAADKVWQEKGLDEKQLLQKHRRALINTGQEWVEDESGEKQPLQKQRRATHRSGTV